MYICGGTTYYLLDAVCEANLPGVSGAAAPRLQIVRGDLRAAGGGFFAAGSLRPEQKRLPCRFYDQTFCAGLFRFFLFRINRHKTQVKSGGGSLEGGACSPLNGRQPDKSEYGVTNSLRPCGAPPSEREAFGKRSNNGHLRAPSLRELSAVG